MAVRRSGSTVATTSALARSAPASLGNCAVDGGSTRRGQLHLVERRADARVERPDQHDPEHRDRDEPRDARHGIVHAGRDAGVLRLDRVHHRRGQRRHHDRHPKTEHGNRREERRPIGATDLRARKERQPDGRDDGTDGQGQAAADPRHETAGPARQDKHQDRERQQRRAGISGGIVLHLDEVHRNQPEHRGQRAVEEQRQQIGQREHSRSEQTERNHRSGHAAFNDDKRDQ